MLLKRLAHKIRRFILLQKREKVKAIFEDDLIPVLSGLNLYEKIENGEMACLFCEKVITVENIGVLIKVSNNYEIICSDPKCLSKIQS